jgi:phosphopantothenoylcysteine synthetase/decarboxylase
MRILVTAGNTQVPIDRVRCITNIFTGQTGARIALHAHAGGHEVRLLTSHPDVVAQKNDTPPSDRWAVHVFKTFDDLHHQMEDSIRNGDWDAVIHCAAVSDYLAAGVYAPARETRFDVRSGQWISTGPASLMDRSAGKVKSDEPELWLRLARAPKLIDFVRTEWGFRGVLVKFKLEVAVDTQALIDIAERSRKQSDADLIVANTLEDRETWAVIGSAAGPYQRVNRGDLPARLLEHVERVHRERAHG